MASVLKHLLAALDDLVTDELKRFKWHLKNHKGISTAALEKADAPDTVDLMRKHFGPEEAVKITVDILREMNHYHLAEELENKHKQDQAESNIEDHASAGAQSKPIDDTFTNIDQWTRNDFLQYSYQLTLDLNTVNQRLRLSESNRVITYTDADQLKPRSLRYLGRSKATELGQFLVYTGKLVLSGIQCGNKHLTVPLLGQSTCVLCKLLQYYFVTKGRELYGPTFLVYNVHSMLHLASDGKSYGYLDECSAFPFENYMQKMKRMVCSGKSPLVQIVKRIRENQPYNVSKEIKQMFTYVEFFCNHLHSLWSPVNHQ
ncbi:hypothetical protein QQF64_036375 [Cirrhinus molitorella]|uniref:Pyrin domain-containing protein n=1 Tax=Cirrhinus molitorella TaxID=172907 RepID=A0ABR3NIB7_9TELE